MSKTVTLYLENGKETTIYYVVYVEEMSDTRLLLQTEDGVRIVVNVDNVVYFSVIEDGEESDEESDEESEWINDMIESYRCKNCGEMIKKNETHMFFGRYVFYDYCPNCGRKQRNGGENVT